MRRLAGTAAALLALASGVAAVPARAASTSLTAARGVLGKRTTVTWTGSTTIRLTLTGKTRYVDGDVDLTVAKGTYAFVRVVQPYQPGCPESLGPRCFTDRFSYIKGATDLDQGVPPSRRHAAAVAVPPTIDTPYIDVVLFTDGQASVTFTTTLRGSYSYRAIGKVHGRAARLRSTCVPAGCTTPAGRANGYVYGGETFDLRGAGWAEVFVTGGSADPAKPAHQVHSVAPCLFPNPNRRDASPEPADHPRGCDDADAPAEAAYAALQHAASAQVSLGGASNVPWSGARGRQYVGFQAIGAGPAPSDPRAFGIWFRFPS